MRLEVTEPAARRIAHEAARQPRLGARALKEVFRRVIRGYEFDPRSSAPDGRLLLDVAQVDEALATFRQRSDSALTTSGWGGDVAPPPGA